MRDGIGRDKCLKGVGSYVVKESYFLVFEVNCQHVVDNVEDGQTIGGQFDDNRPMCEGLIQRSQSELSFIGHIETDIADVTAPLNVVEPPPKLILVA